MTLPEGVQPSGPTDPEVEETSAFTEPAVEEAPVEEEETPEEAASDAALRTWARDNGIEGVPASGKLSGAWRDQITTAMAAALDPKEEVSVEDTSSPEPSTSEMMKDSSKSEEPAVPEKEYHSVFQAPNTFMSSQAFTA